MHALLIVFGGETKNVCTDELFTIQSITCIWKIDFHFIPTFNTSGVWRFKQTFNFKMFVNFLVECISIIVFTIDHKTKVIYIHIFYKWFAWKFVQFVSWMGSNVAKKDFETCQRKTACLLNSTTIKWQLRLTLYQMCLFYP